MEQSHEGDAESGKASEVERADIRLGEKIARHRHHPVAKAAAEASEIGDQEPLYALSAGILAIGLVTRDARVRATGLSMLTAVGVADLIKRGAKRCVRRTRPNVWLDRGEYDADAGGSDHKPEQSFPSGHTACTVAAARALSRNVPGATAPTAAAAIAISLGRIAKGAHWPLDVAAGAAIGLVAEGISALIFRASRRQCRRR